MVGLQKDVGDVAERLVGREELPLVRLSGGRFRGCGARARPQPSNAMQGESRQPSSGGPAW